MFTFNENRVVSGDGSKLSVYSWENPKSSNSPLCLIVHGMAEYGLRYKRFVQDMESTNWSFAAYDMRGHGSSDGKRMRMASMEEPLDDLRSVLQSLIGRNEKKRRIVLLGHSFGGLVAALYADKYPDELSGLILSSPALGMYFLFPFMDKFIEFLHFLVPSVVIPKPVQPQKLSHDPQIQSDYVSDPKIYKFVGVDFLYSMLKGIKYAENNIRRLGVPLLMVLAGDDKIVDNRKNVAFFNGLEDKDKEIHICDGLLHETLNELRRQESIERMKKFISERL